MNHLLGKEIVQQNADRLVFALDTGTRSVVGILGIWEESVFTVLDYEQRFHELRAMRDGQIEDISLTARAIQQVKETLENRWGIVLSKVSIAAAGRALKTVTADFEQDISMELPIDAELIRSIEYGAVSAALDTFSVEPASSDPNKSEEPFAPINSTQFSCVGYSVSGYWLDQYPLNNPEGHRGNHLKVGIIAAFLPLSVVRSLYSVTRLCGLTVANLTLEPIAAINAIVPKDIRLLNIAIADIGAGTSDIAITKNGSVVAYDMATTAGDEITETLMQQYLTDFDTAERMKISLSSSSEHITFADILGNSSTCSSADILKTLEPAVSALAAAIAGSILRINGNAPVAVFLIGGGSQIPGLCQQVANLLELQENKVALGGVQPYKHIKLCSEKLLNPEFVTPIGIGAVSTLFQGSDFFSIMINDQKIMIPGSGDLKLVDALLLTGIRSTSLIGRTPPSLVFYLNSEPRTIRSTPSTPGELYLNGAPATLNSSVRQGDQITFVPAKNGNAPKVVLRDFCSFEEGVVCSVNGTPGTPDYVICHQDDIRIFSPETVVDLDSPLSPDADQELDPHWDDSDGTDNQNPGEPDADVAPLRASESATIPAAPDTPEPAQIHVQLNGHWIFARRSETGLLHFVDMLNYVDIDPQKPEGDLILLINGRNAAYMDPVADGDQIEIRWSRGS